MSGLRESLEKALAAGLPVMRHEASEYPTEALPKAQLLDLLALHNDDTVPAGHRLIASEAFVVPDEDPTDIAVDTIARHVIASILSTEEHGAELWENSPLIGQHDWVAITKRVREIERDLAPSEDEYNAAYKHLQTRADS